ncbi:MAG TPA: hypothetical protein H9896_01245, partial [Candidatus Pygmaiobacter gallistercoris]|nr:hypothetical protein [Candidatus Pygmaiobacter gallistercoris]
LTGLVGCGRSESGSAPPAEGAGPLQMMTPAYTHSEIGFVGKEGLYRCENIAKGYLLCYLDYATNQKVALCNRPECRHQDRSCAAWLSNYGAPFVLDGKLYLDCLPEFFDNEVGPYHIQQRNLDGSGAKTVWEAQSGESVTSAIVADDDYFYFFSYQMAEGEEESANYWNRVRRADGSRERIKKIPAFEGYDLFGVTETAVIVVRGSELFGSDFTFFFMDPQTGDTTPAFSFDTEETLFQYLDGQTAYFLDLAENALKTVDLETGERKTVFPDLGLDKIGQEWLEIRLVVDGRYLVLYSSEEQPGAEKLAAVCYAVDLAQQTIRRQDFYFEMTDGEISPYTVNYLLPGEKLLAITGMETEYQRIENYGLVEDYPVDYYTEAVIPVTDFFAGIDNFTPVTTVLWGNS